MQHTLEILLSNSLVACVLALLAIVAGRLCRRPALSHALWVLVLLKLITPPIHSVSIPWPVKAKEVAKIGVPAVAASPRIEAEQEQALAALRMTTPEATGVADQAEIPPHGQEYLPMPPGTGAENAKAAVPETKPAPAPPSGRLRQLSMGQSLLLLWAMGSAVCLCIISFRIRRFFELLRYAKPADGTVRAMAMCAADRLGLKRAPRAFFVPGAVCPMLISIGGRTRLLIPMRLWQRLEDEQRESMLLHELAHLRRRDHWVRLVEILVTVVYWWHPLTWWARAGLRRAEEQCCDAWVMWAMPGGASDYATALLDAVDLASAAGGVPALASGMGEFHDLKRRLAMIKQGTTRKAMGWIGSLGVGAVAAVLLPVAPLLAQDPRPRQPQDNAPAATPHVIEVAVPESDSPMVIVNARTAPAHTQNVPHLNPDDLAKLDKEALIGKLAETQARLEEAMLETQVMKARLQELQARLSKMEAGRAFGGGGFGGGGYGVMKAPPTAPTPPGVNPARPGFPTVPPNPMPPGAMPGMPGTPVLPPMQVAPMPPRAMEGAMRPTLPTVPLPGQPGVALPEGVMPVPTPKMPSDATPEWRVLRGRVLEEDYLAKNADARARVSERILAELSARRDAIQEKVNQATREDRIAALEAKLAELLAEVKSLEGDKPIRIEKPKAIEQHYSVTAAVPEAGTIRTITFVVIAPDAGAAAKAAVSKFPGAKIMSIKEVSEGGERGREKW